MNNDLADKKTGFHRLISVDALRGFDMFWIVGAEWLFQALHKISGGPATDFLTKQLQHVHWAGMAFLDLIFPLFIFIVGISTVFSLTKALEQGGRKQAVKRIIVRSILIYLVGIFYSGGLSGTWPDVRLSGVLNRIAVCYLFGGILFCFFRQRGLILVTLSILIGYWALMTFVPIRNYQFEQPDEMVKKADAATQKKGGNKRPQMIRMASEDYLATTNYVTGKFEEGLNLANHIDFRYLPGKRNRTFWDTEGILSTLPAIANGLLGILAGLLLQRRNCGELRKVLLLAGFGLAGVVLGWLWNPQFPIIKRIWTSSFVLTACGYSALLLALFYWLIDVKNLRAWCRPFVWIGANSITIYLVASLVNFRQIASRFVGGDISAWLDKHLVPGTGDLLTAMVALTLVFVFMRFLYQRKIFLRL